MKFERPKSVTPLGEGGYKKVFSYDSKSSERVWAEYKSGYTPQQAKSIYYLNNIIHLLFPDHTVRIHQSGVDKEGVTYMDNEYISHDADEVHQAIQTETLSNDGQPFESSPSFDDRSKVMEFSSEINTFIDMCEEAGLRENFAAVHTWGPQDIIFDESGNFRFVDVDPAWEEPEEIGEEGYTQKCLRFSPQKLQAAINTLEGERYQKAQALFDRLLDLCRSVGFEV